ncbi:MAG: hypothetical protein R3C54_11645 [Parvularculaceae bacterium]
MEKLTSTYPSSMAQKALQRAAGDFIVAGSLNVTGPVTVRATASAGESFLAGMIRMMEKTQKARLTNIGR